jgi:hypothetical protein
VSPTRPPDVQEEGIGFMARQQKQDWKTRLEGTRGMAQWIAIYQAYNAIFKLG